MYILETGGLVPKDTPEIELPSTTVGLEGRFDCPGMGVPEPLRAIDSTYNANEYHTLHTVGDSTHTFRQRRLGIRQSFELREDQGENSVVSHGI
jgi:hypothetical protein